MRTTLVPALVMTALSTGAAAVELRAVAEAAIPEERPFILELTGRLRHAGVLRPDELPLARALDAEEMPFDLSFRSGVLHFTGDPGTSETVVLVEIPLDDMGARVDPSTGAWQVNLSALAFVRDAEDRLVSWLSRDYPLRAARAPGLRGRSVLLKRTLRLAPGHYTLEAAVGDRESGRIGARRLPFVVPEASPDLSVGSVAVVRFQEAPPGTRDLFDPLLVRGVRALPVLGAPIAVESGRVGVLATLHPERGAGPISVTVEFRREGEVLAQASPEVPKPTSDGRITLAHRFTLPSIEPGQYEIHVRVRQGRERASAATSFLIAPPTPVGMLSPDVARAGAWH
jgi:hypothetical protein